MSIEDRIEEWSFDRYCAAWKSKPSKPLIVTSSELAEATEYAWGAIVYRKNKIVEMKIDGFLVIFKVISFNDYFESIKH